MDATQAAFNGLMIVIAISCGIISIIVDNSAWLVGSIIAIILLIIGSLL